MAGSSLFGTLMLIILPCFYTIDNSTVNNSSFISDLTETEFLPHLPSSDHGWRSAAIKNVFILVIIIVVILVAVFSFRYYRTMKKRASSKSAAYNKLNTSTVDSDEYEMSIYEKK